MSLFSIFENLEKKLQEDKNKSLNDQLLKLLYNSDLLP